MFTTFIIEPILQSFIPDLSFFLHKNSLH